MNNVDYCLKYEYYREMLFSYHDAVINTMNATVLMYAFNALDNMNMKYCKNVLFDNYSNVLNYNFEMDRKYNSLMTEIFLNDKDVEVMESVEIITEPDEIKDIKQFIKDVNDFSEQVEEFEAYFMQMLEELAFKKMFITNSAILERLEIIFNKLYEECEEIDEYLEELREDYG